MASKPFVLPMAPTFILPKAAEVLNEPVSYLPEEKWSVQFTVYESTPKSQPSEIEKLWNESLQAAAASKASPVNQSHNEFLHSILPQPESGSYPPETIPAPPMTLPQTKEAAQFTRQLIDKLRRWSAPSLPSPSLPVAPQSSIILLPSVPPQQIAGELQLLDSKLAVLAYRMDQLAEQQSRTTKQLQTLQQQQAHLTQQLNLTVQQLNLAAAQNQKMMEIMSRLDADCQERARRSPVDQFRPSVSKRKIRKQCQERANARQAIGGKDNNAVESTAGAGSGGNFSPV